MPNKFQPGDAVERITTATLTSGTVEAGDVGVVCRRISSTSYAVFYKDMPKCVLQFEHVLQKSTRPPPACPPGTPGC